MCIYVSRETPGTPEAGPWRLTMDFPSYIPAMNCIITANSASMCILYNYNAYVCVYIYIYTDVCVCIHIYIYIYTLLVCI